MSVKNKFYSLKQKLNKMKIKAEIRTNSALVGWDVAKSKKHDCSMVESPQVWLFIKVKGKYYPYQIA